MSCVTTDLNGKWVVGLVEVFEGVFLDVPATGDAVAGETRPYTLSGATVLAVAAPLAGTQQTRVGGREQRSLRDVFTIHTYFATPAAQPGLLIKTIVSIKKIFCFKRFKLF